MRGTVGTGQRKLQRFKHILSKRTIDAERLPEFPFAALLLRHLVTHDLSCP
jgi:hypothetical protein